MHNCIKGICSDAGRAGHLPRGEKWKLKEGRSGPKKGERGKAHFFHILPQNPQYSRNLVNILLTLMTHGGRGL